MMCIFKSFNRCIKFITVFFVISSFSTYQENQNSVEIDSSKNNEISLSIANDSIKENSVTVSQFTLDGKQQELIFINNSSNNTSVIYVVIISILLLIGVFFLRRRKLKNSPKNKLTKQEYTISELINSGKTNNEISELLFISKSTVKTHINNIYRKLDISTRDELKKKITN